jgi:type IV pilus assembly protein PilF
MKFDKVILLAVGVLLAGCVTTTTGELGEGANEQEASKLNRDLGISYLRKGDLEQARTKLEKSIQVEPNNPLAHRALGLTYEGLGDDKGAEKEYRTAVKQAPEDADALNQLAVFLCLHANEKEALKLFDRAIAVPLYQSRYMLYTNAGTCVQSSDLARAEDYLRRAIALEPDYSVALLQLAEVAYEQEYYLQSRAFLERYFAVEAATPNSLWLGYQVELSMQDINASIVFADRLLEEFPESIEARMLLEERRNAG